MKFFKNIFLEKQFEKVLKKAKEPEQISFKLAIENIKKICIVYPHDLKLEHEADNCLKPILDYFEKADLTIIKPNELHKEDLRFSGLPNKKYFLRFNHSFDLIINLNLEKDKFTTFIVANLVSKLKVRIYSDQETDSLYHLSISSNKSNLKDHVDTLLKYFTKFKVSLI